MHRKYRTKNRKYRTKNRNLELKPNNLISFYIGSPEKKVSISSTNTILENKADAKVNALFDLSVMPDLEEKFGEASLTNHHLNIDIALRNRYALKHQLTLTMLVYLTTCTCDQNF